jgi:hypothetical protein
MQWADEARKLVRVSPRTALGAVTVWRVAAVAAPEDVAAVVRARLQALRSLAVCGRMVAACD